MNWCYVYLYLDLISQHVQYFSDHKTIEFQANAVKKFKRFIIIILTKLSILILNLILILYLILYIHGNWIYQYLFQIIQLFKWKRISSINICFATVVICAYINKCQCSITQKKNCLLNCDWGWIYKTVYQFTSNKSETLKFICIQIFVLNRPNFFSGQTL